MKVIVFLLLTSLLFACNDGKVDQLQSDVREIKQSLQRIEMLLGSPSNSSTSPTTVVPQRAYTQQYKTGKSYSSGRCQAITRKGTQCSRNARSGGYCWQHGG